MKKIRMIASHPLAMVLMVSSLMLISCGTDDYINNANANEANASKNLQAESVANSVTYSSKAIASYTDAELFESIIFADGPVTSMIPDLADFRPEAMGLDSVKTKDFRELKATLIADIQSKDPGFMKSFKSAITSGDVVSVKQAIEKSQPVVYNALKSHLASKNIKLEGLISEYNGGNDIYPELPDIPVTVNGVALVVVVTVVLVVGIAVAILYTKVKVEDPWEQNNGMHQYVKAKNMKREKVYASVATRLKV